MNDKIDILNRQPFINQILEIIDNVAKRRGKLSFAIDGCWGSGKTFLIERLEQQLENKNKYFIFHYNCWKYDYYDEPLIAIVSAMLYCASKNVMENASDAMCAGWKYALEEITSIAQTIIKNKTGIDFVGEYQKVNNILKEQNKEKFNYDSLYSFFSTLSSIQEKIKSITDKKTMVIVVDELDRCLPEYSIKVLERIHHFFEPIENIVVLFAIDGHQLDASIKKIYGEEVKTHQYLKKFISFTMLLSAGNIEAEFTEKYNTYFTQFSYQDEKENELVFTVIKQLFSLDEIDMRSQEKIIAKAELIHQLICDGKSDLCVLLFEVISCIVKHYMSKMNDNCSDVLPKFWDDIYHHRISFSVNQNLFLCLQELEKTVGGDYRDNDIINQSNEFKKPRIAYGDCVIDRTFILLSNVFGDGQTEYCLYQQYPNFEQELEICEKFNAYSKIIL